MNRINLRTQSFFFFLISHKFLKARQIGIKKKYIYQKIFVRIKTINRIVNNSNKT